MAKTDDAAFEEFLRRTVPLRTENRAVQRHQAAVGGYRTARFDGARIIATGSTDLGTALQRHSDADHFVVLLRGNLTNDIAEMLRCVRSALRRPFPNTDISASKPAVVVPFGRNGRELLDVAPAVFATRAAEGHDVSDIPDGAGGWMRSNPGADKVLTHGVHPIVVAERLGHVTIGITLQNCSYVVPGLQQRATDIVGEALSEQV